MKKKVRLIYTICHQTGPDRFDQGFATVDTEIEIPETICGRLIKDYAFVGLEFTERKGGGNDEQGAG